MSDPKFARITVIRNDRLEADGIIEGTLATNGEANDGHIVDIAGMRAEAGAPLLWSHDGFSGRNNLGSWLGFTHIGARSMKKLGDQELRGTAQIEVERGAGANLKFRQDVAEMVAAGHVRSFSAMGRPDPDEPPVLRTGLPKDHPAYVNGNRATTAQRYGFYFPRSVLAEGSIVTVGSDDKAVMRHIESLDDPERIKPWLMALDLSPEVARSMYALAVGQAESEVPDEAPVEEVSEEPPSPVVEDPAEPSEEPAETPVVTPLVQPTAPLADRALEMIRSAFPEFANEAPDLVAQMTQEVFGTYQEELRRKLDDYAYRRLGRVPPRR